MPSSENSGRINDSLLYVSAVTISTNIDKPYITTQRQRVKILVKVLFQVCKHL